MLTLTEGNLMKSHINFYDCIPNLKIQRRRIEIARVSFEGGKRTGFKGCREKTPLTFQPIKITPARSHMYIKISVRMHIHMHGEIHRGENPSLVPDHY